MVRKMVCSRVDKIILLYYNSSLTVLFSINQKSNKSKQKEKKMDKIWQRYNSFVGRILQGVPLNWRIDPNYITVSRLFLVYFALFAFPRMNPWIALFVAAAGFTLTA